MQAAPFDPQISVVLIQPHGIHNELAGNREPPPSGATLIYENSVHAGRDSSPFPDVRLPGFLGLPRQGKRDR